MTLSQPLDGLIEKLDAILRDLPSDKFAGFRRRTPIDVADFRALVTDFRDTAEALRAIQSTKTGDAA